MNTEKAIEMLPLMAKIIEESELIDYAQQFKDGITQVEGIKIVVRVVANMNKYQNEAYEVLAAFTELPIEEIKNQSAKDTFAQVKEFMMDQELMDFFTQLV